MSELTMNANGEIAIPKDLRRRYGFSPNTPIRVVETRSGVLLVPITGAPPDDELAKELAEWQALGMEAWAMFPYEEADP